MSSAPSGTAADISNKSTHGFCKAYIKTGTCPLGDTCKFIHEQPNADKPSGSNHEIGTNKTTTRTVDMSSIKSTITVSNEQRPAVVVVSSSTPSTRTVIESVNATTDLSDRRLSSSDRKQSQNHASSSKTKPSSTPTDASKSSSKKKTSSSHDTRHSTSKPTRVADSDSAVSSASDSEYQHSSHKRKKRSDRLPSSSKHKKHDSPPPPPPHRVDESAVNDHNVRPASSSKKSPKRTILITPSNDRKKEDTGTRTAKDEAKPKSKPVPEIEFLGSKKVHREKKSNETIHQQAEGNKKSRDMKREKKSPVKSIATEQKKNLSRQRHHSSTANHTGSNSNEKHPSSKTDESKHPASKTQNSSERYERADRNSLQLIPPVVQLSPNPSMVVASEPLEKVTSSSVIEPEKTARLQSSSPVCVILDDDSSPIPPTDKKPARHTPTTSVKKAVTEHEKANAKPAKRSRDSEKAASKDKSSETSETKRKRLNDGNSKKVAPISSKESRSSSHRSDTHRPEKTSSSRKYHDKADVKVSRSNDSKDRTSTGPSSKSRGSNHSRRETSRSSPEKKRSIDRRGKEKGNIDITDSEDHLEEPILPKQTALEAYMAMDWSLLSRDKRIPLNAQVTSRITRTDASTNVLDCLGICDRLLTPEQKEKLTGQAFQSSPLTHYMKHLQTRSSSAIVHSCQRRFGSCAKDMIDMRHRWFTKSIEPVQQYEFINKEHYIAFQQAMNALLDRPSADPPNVQIETTTADLLLS